MKKELKGSVSAFGVLLMAVLLSFVLVIVEGARENAIRLKAECAMDLSMQSVFAEYNRQLLKQYDLFFIDASYGQPGASPERVGEHLEGYLADNFALGATSFVKKDVLDLSVEEVNVLDFSLASDNGGEILKRQAVAYMKELYGLALLEDLENQLTVVEDYGLLSRDINGERMASQSFIDNYEIPPRQVSEDEWEEVELDNPADAVNGARGVLALVLDRDTEISTAAINPANYISRREINKGSGLAGRDGLFAGDEWIFNEYLLKKCGSYTGPKEEGALQYQMEYILMGKDTDVDNLKAVVNRLLFMREVSNVSYLFSDAGKVAEAEALAIAVTSAVAAPELAEPVKIVLLFAWAYAESVYDVRVVLQGGKVPLLKTSDTWHYSLSGMLEFASDEAVDTDGEGIDYTGYLRIFLALENRDTKTLRAMDIIEMDIRKCPGNRQFRLDTCMDFLQAEVFTSSGYGYNHSITRSYFYQ